MEPSQVSALDELQAQVGRSAQQGDGVGVLRALVAAWPLCRHPALAEAIDGYAWRLQPQPPEIASNQDWQNLAQRADPGSVETLLASPWQGLRWPTLRKRLTALGRFPPDPRIAAFAALVLDSGRADPPEVRDEAARVRQWHGPPVYQPGSVLPVQVQAMIEAAAPRQLDPGEALLEAILASPDDDGPRLVYADYLMERGDPLGAFLASALAPDAPPGPSEGHWEWCQRLLGPLGGAQVRLKRGFPDRIDVHGRLRGLRHWSTIREVRWYVPPPELLEQLPELRRARLLESVHLLDPYERRPPWMPDALPLLEALELREIGMSTSSWDASTLDPERWPALERLSLWVNDPEMRLDARCLGRLGQRPIEIVLQQARVRSGQLVACALGARKRCAPGVTCLSVGLNDPKLESLHVALERSSDFRALRLSGVSAQNVGHLWRLFTQVQPSDIDQIVVETPLWQDRAFRKRVLDALKKLSSVRAEISSPRVRPTAPGQAPE